MAATPEYLGASLQKLQQAPQASEVHSFLPALANVAFSLIFVILLIYAVYWILRRWRATRSLVAPDMPGALRVLEKIWLDNRHGLALVEFGDKLLLLGLGEDVTLLARLDDPATVKKLREQALQPSGLQSFREQLARVSAQLRSHQWRRNKEMLRQNTDKLSSELDTLRSLKNKEGEGK